MARIDKETVVEIIARTLKLKANQISLDSPLREELGADSLSVVEIAMECEKTFGIEIPDEDTRCFKNTSAIIAYLDAKINKVLPTKNADTSAK